MGQTLVPKFIYSDYENHYCYITIDSIKGDSVEDPKQLHGGVTGVKLGKSTVKCVQLLAKPSSEYVMNVQNQQTYQAQVCYALPYKTLKIGVGDVAHITPEIYAGDYNKSMFTDDVIWTSDNEDVVMVGSGGYIGSIYALKRGKAVVTMKNTALGAETYLTVEVGDPPTSISFDQKSPLELGVGEAKALSVSFPSGQYWRNVVYESNDSTVASVTANGEVKALKQGTATITATAGNVKATLTVKVLAAPTGIHFIDSNGKKITSATVLKDMRVGIPQFKLEGNNVGGYNTVTIRKDGGILTEASFLANKIGTITITATTYNNHKATLTITVENNATLTKLQARYKALYDTNPNNGVKSKLVKVFNELNKKGSLKDKSLAHIMSDFTSWRREYAISTDINGGIDGFQIAFQDPTGAIKTEDVEKAFKLALFEEFAKSNNALKDIDKCKDGVELVNMVADMIKKDPAKGKVTLNKVTYAFDLNKISSLGVTLEMGTVKVTPNGGTSRTFSIMFTNVSFSSIKSYMNKLEELGQAQVTDAVVQSITGGIKDMGIPDAMNYMKGLYEAKAPLKAVLIDALNYTINGLGTALGKLIINGKSALEELLDLENHWKKLEAFANTNRTLLMDAILQKSGSSGILTLDQINTLKNVLAEVEKSEEVGQYLLNFDPNTLAKKIDEAWKAF